MKTFKIDCHARIICEPIKADSFEEAKELLEKCLTDIFKIVSTEKYFIKLHCPISLIEGSTYVLTPRKLFGRPFHYKK